MNIKLIVLDVDGTLTDGKIIIDNRSNEYKCFNARDGFALSEAIKHGMEAAVITGRQSSIVERRCRELGIKLIYQGVRNKAEVLKQIICDKKLSNNEVAYIGDDINDMGCVKMCGFKACPADAAVEIIRMCDYVAAKNGGEGAVREILEVILKSNGIWDRIIDSFKNQ